MRVASVGGIKWGTRPEEEQNPREALSDTPDCCSSIAFFPTATADHVMGVKPHIRIIIAGWHPRQKDPHDLPQR